MAKKRYKPEEIINKLREVDVALGAGKTVAETCRGIEISKHTYYRWRREYGGLKVDQVKRIKELEQENQHLRKAVSELTLDKQILKEAIEGRL